MMARQISPGIGPSVTGGASTPATPVTEAKRPRLSALLAQSFVTFPLSSVDGGGFDADVQRWTFVALSPIAFDLLTIAPVQMAGRKIEVIRGDEVLASGVLAASGDVAKASLTSAVSLPVGSEFVIRLTRPAGAADVYVSQNSYRERGSLVGDGALRFLDSTSNRYAPALGFTLGTAAPKDVNGPLDPADWPQIKSETALSAGQIAVLNNGSDPPRLAGNLQGKLWYGAPWGLDKAAAAAGTGPAYTPTYQTPFTVTNPSPAAAERIVQVRLTTAHAMSTGKDIRAASTLTPGVFLPMYVASVRLVPGGGAYEYLIFLMVPLAPSETAALRFTYGDAAALEGVYAASAVARLSTYAQGRLIGGMWAYQDRSHAYLPADFDTAGVQILGQRDDQSAEVGLDGKSVTYNGVQYLSLWHQSNGALRFGEQGPGSSSTRTPNDLQFMWGDAYETWRRQVALPDGLAWHILTGRNGYTSDCRFTIRYIFPGRWIVTLVQRTGYLGSFLSARVSDQEATFATPQEVPVDDPNGPYVLVVEPVALPVALGSEGGYNSPTGHAHGAALS